MVKVQTRLFSRRREEVVFITNLAAQHGLAPHIHKLKIELFNSYLFMDKVPGETTKKILLDLEKKGDKEEIKNLDAAIVSVTKQLHDIGIRHVSLHKSNIMAVRSATSVSKWKVMFIDFERAKFYDRSLTARERRRDNYRFDPPDSVPMTSVNENKIL